MNTNMRTTESPLEACRRVAERLGFDGVHEFVDKASLARRRRTRVRRIGIHIEGRRPKVAIVTVDFANSARSTYRFAGEDGAKA